MSRSRNSRAEGVMALAVAAATVLLLDVMVPQHASVDDADDVLVARAPVGGSWLCTAGVGGAEAVVRPIFGDDPVEDDVPADDDAISDDASTDDDDAVSLAVTPEENDADEELVEDEEASEDSEDSEANVYQPEPRDAAGVELVIVRPDTQWDVVGSVTIREFAAGEEVNWVNYDTAAASEIRYTVSDHSDPTFVEVSWSGPPVTVSRIWSLTGDPIPATMAGGCQTTSAYGFVAPGFSTADGANVRLRIANPYPSSAAVSIRFFTPDGVEEPAVLSNLSIAPFSVYEAVVNDVLPELPDVSAQVDVLTGRVAVEGSVFAAVTGGATRGMSLLPVLPRERSLIEETPVTDEALGEPRYVHATAVSFDRNEARSWIWFTNVSDAVARVDLVLHTSEGTAPPDGLSEVSIPPHSVRRIALQDTFPDGVDIAGVSGRTDSPSVYMAVGSDVAGEEQPQGIGLQAGQAPDARWVLSGPRSDRRSERVLITNVSDTDATVDVWFNDGEAVSEPEELQAKLIPAGTSRVVTLDEYLIAGFGYTVFVRAPDDQVVVSSFGFTSGVSDEHLVLDPGVSSDRWLVQSPQVSIRHDEGLIRRLSGRADD